MKEIPAAFFRDAGAYMFFSHTFKGQPHNMPMLRRFVERKATLIDYEKVTGEQNRRLIFFGNYAGTAGMFETLYTLGKRLEWEGIQTPFASLQRPIDYPSLGAAKEALKDIAGQIGREGLPAAIAPIVIGFLRIRECCEGLTESPGSSSK